MQQDYSSLIVRRCDKAMAFFFYALIYFLPISTAIIEWCFCLTLLSYLVKRGVIFYDRVREEIRRRERVESWDKIRLFFQSYQPVNDALNKPLGIFLLIAFLSVLFSIDGGLSLKGFVFKLLENVFIYFFFIEVIHSRKRLKIFFSVFLISFTLIVTNGIFQYFIREEFIHHQPITDGRITSSFNHANDFAGYLLVLLPCLLNFSWIRYLKAGGIKTFSQETRKSPYGFFVSDKFCYGVTFLGIFTVICLGLTFSRAAWLAFGGSLLILSFRNKRILAFFLLLIILFSVIFIPKMIKERQSNIHNRMGFLTMSSRPIYWREAFELIKERPVLGVGLNAYTLASSQHRFSGYPHNSYLQMAAETGIVGLLSFLWIINVFFDTGFSQLKKIKDPFAAELLLGLLAGFSGFLIQSYFDTNFYSGKLSILMWVVMGLIAAIPKIEAAGAVCPVRTVGNKE
ncbi:MAG TPA: hypothetical protein DD723_07605 [Candidatus Omnitrophica bacterium]|nr:MAG: hypothetical protein A2Z81_09920 [Omnitrophica WOR_2 bacterium GWA2_45_18]HBR15391.1 hypothetical protein [Candidatus Omnitrophota bacterium]